MKIFLFHFVINILNFVKVEMQSFYSFERLSCKSLCIFHQAVYSFNLVPESYVCPQAVCYIIPSVCLRKITLGDGRWGVGGGEGQCSCKGGGGTSLAVRDSWVESVAKVQNEEGWSVGTVSAVWWAQYAQGREHSLKHLGTWACRHLGVPLWLAGVCRGEGGGGGGGGGGMCEPHTEIGVSSVTFSLCIQSGLLSCWCYRSPMELSFKVEYKIRESF